MQSVVHWKPNILLSHVRFHGYFLFNCNCTVQCHVDQIWGWQGLARTSFVICIFVIKKIDFEWTVELVAQNSKLSKSRLSPAFHTRPMFLLETWWKHGKIFLLKKYHPISTMYLSHKNIDHWSSAWAMYFVPCWKRIDYHSLQETSG
jgi:hypothetical protein